MAKTFLISDTHFYHENILKFAMSNGQKLRNFSNVHEMNDHIIRKWNGTVGKDDKVYHLGDVAFASFSRVKEIFDQLNGTKILIMGNHDHFKPHEYAQLFKEVKGSHVLNNIILTHIPVHPHQFPRFVGNIHGHLHNHVMEDPRYFNVSVERHNYYPVEWDYLYDYFKELRHT